MTKTTRLTVGLAGLVVLASVVAYLFHRPRAVVPAPAPVSTPVDCDVLLARYRAALANVQTCTQDDECVADERGKVWSALDGCTRFRRRDADLARTLDPLEAAWRAQACSQSDYMTCAPARAQCSAGRCGELPRDPIPRDWRRVTHRGKFSFFVPADAEENKGIHGEDSEVGEWKTPRSTIDFDYGQYGTNIEGSAAEGDVVLTREPITVGDSNGMFTLTRTHEGVFLAGVHFRELENSISRYERVLTLWAECKKRTDCETEGRTIVRSLELH